MIAEIQETASRIRQRVLQYVLAEGGGYLSQACSAAEMLAVLYQQILRLGPSNGPLVPQPFTEVPGRGGVASSGGRYNGAHQPDHDRFIFSPVHYSLVLYATLIEVGRLAEEGLAQFNQDGSTVEMIGAEHSPGIEVTAGSLAQAASVASGIALGRKLKGEPGRVVVFVSDGEFQEGQTWEMLAAAAFHQLDNLYLLVDANAQQCDGAMSETMRIEPLADRLTGFGAHALEVDGHDIGQLIESFDIPHPGKPLVIIGRTDPCRGMPILSERSPRLHYVRFKDEEERLRYQAALAE